jgi:hypothetical protein
MKFIVNYVVPMLWRSDVTLSSMSHITNEEGTWLFQGIYAILGTTDLHRFWWSCTTHNIVPESNVITAVEDPQKTSSFRKKRKAQTDLNSCTDLAQAVPHTSIYIYIYILCQRVVKYEYSGWGFWAEPFGFRKALISQFMIKTYIPYYITDR